MPHSPQLTPTSGAAILRRHARADLLRHRTLSLVLLSVLTLAAFLTATGALVLERVVGAQNQLFEVARPPHYLQLHQGSYDPAALQRFARAHPEIQAWQLSPMLGIDSAALSWTRPATGQSGDLSSSLIDNLFQTQNPQFDQLIGEQGQVVQPSAGQVYVPIAYRQQFGLQLGDQLRIRTQHEPLTLRVAGFVKDAQMASSLSSSTRFVIAPEDLAALTRAGGGDPEIMVSYRLSHGSGADLAKAYAADFSLPSNGQGVTFAMIAMINAFSDGLVAVALLLISGLLALIAVASVRFVIAGTLQDEVHQLGAMKAIGLSHRTISALYLGKYAALTAVGCVLGGLAAIPAAGLLTRGVQTNYAQATVAWTTVLVPVTALVVLFAVVIGLCLLTLLRVRRVEVVDALIHGSTLTGAQAARRARRVARQARATRLGAAGSLNWRLIRLDLRTQWGQWALIPVVFALAAIVAVVPTLLRSTIQDPAFLTHLGAPNHDLRADIPSSADADRVRSQLATRWASDPRIAQVHSFALVRHQVQGPEGAETITVEVGAQAGAGLSYLTGGAPGPGQIALSTLNADALGLSVGDTLVGLDGTGRSWTVSGIYQDVTHGGRTAKLLGEIRAGADKYVLYADLVPGADPTTVAREYDSGAGVKVIPTQEYLNQTLAYLVSALTSAQSLAVGLALAVSGLIAALFVRLRIARDRRQFGTLSVLGFTGAELGTQLVAKMALLVTLGTGLGVLFSATAGEWLVSQVLALSGMGLSRIEFLPDWRLAYLAWPVLLLGVGVLGALFQARQLSRTPLTSWLRP